MVESKRILVVDDDEAITSALSVLFAGAGYEVMIAHSGMEALARLAEGPDLLVLDVMMPEVDGYEVCRRAREGDAYVPIVMLTAKDETWERVAGLELGADAYLTKPFDSGELLAQVKALFRLVDSRKEGVQEPDVLICGPLRLSPSTHEVEVKGQAMSLSPKEFDLLRYLMQRPGRVVGRETLLRDVWGYDYPGDGRTIDTHVRRLRAKIEADPAEPQFLQTVRGFGYRLIAPDA